MKKLIFVLAVFIATPAFALDVNVVDIGGNQVAVQYKDADPCNLPRAFALELTIDLPGEFIDVRGYKNDVVHGANGPDEIGESNSLYPGFGIYPAKITFDSAGDVTTWGDPIALQTDPGAKDQILPSSDIVLEFASLYYGNVNAPDPCGTLCILEYDCGGITTGLNITMVDEATYRGGMVYEDGTQAPVLDSIEVCKEGYCFPNTPGYEVQYGYYKEYLATGVDPNCWCASVADGNHHYQCDGDAGSDVQTMSKYRVYTNDLGLVVAHWKKRITDPTIDPCADIDHDKQTMSKYRVYTNDLGIVVANWKKKDSVLPNDCPRPW